MTMRKLTLNNELGACYLKLRPGMTFSLSRSSEVMLIAADTRPRHFHYLAPVKNTPELAAGPNNEERE